MRLHNDRWRRYIYSTKIPDRSSRIIGIGKSGSIMPILGVPRGWGLDLANSIRGGGSLHCRYLQDNSLRQSDR